MIRMIIGIVVIIISFIFIISSIIFLVKWWKEPNKKEKIEVEIFNKTHNTKYDWKYWKNNKVKLLRKYKDNTGNFNYIRKKN
jgi:predicted RND superfamily exporter protein